MHYILNAPLCMYPLPMYSLNYCGTQHDLEYLYSERMFGPRRCISIDQGGGGYPASVVDGIVKRMGVAFQRLVIKDQSRCLPLRYRLYIMTINTPLPYGYRVLFIKSGLSYPSHVAAVRN